MNKFLLGIAFLSVFASCESTKKVNEAIKLTNSIDSVSYALGINIGESLEQQGLDSLNTDLVRLAMQQAFADDSNAIMDNETALAYLNTYFQKMQQEKVAKALEEGNAFLAENGKRAGVTTTASGLQIEVLQEGTGLSPVDGDKVMIFYTGTLLDGTVFDTKPNTGQPAIYPMNGMMVGWTEGLKLMKEGGRYKIYLPSELGFGQMGGGPIPPNSVLTFDIELLKVNPPTETK